MMVYIKILLYVLISSLFIILTAAFLVLVERKIMAGIQRREGPNVVGVYGFLQPFADAFKLISKEFVKPRGVNSLIFILSAIISMSLSLCSWIFIPFYEEGSLIITDISLLFILVLSSLGVFSIFFAGWSSNNSYALLGAFRVIGQMISYEVFMLLSLVPLVIVNQSLDIYTIFYAQKYIWNVVFFFPSFILFFIAILAETNRAPFDLPEAEAELVAGFNVEYSGILFTLFFLAEYINILTMSALMCLFFFGGCFLPLNLLNILGIDNFLVESSIFGFKTVIIASCFVWVRATYPRIKYDNLIMLCWKNLMPLIFSLVFFYSVVYLFFLI